MNVVFQRLLIISLMVPYFTYSMEMPSLETDPEFRAQYNQILDEYKKIEKAHTDLMKSELSPEKRKQFTLLQRIQIKSLKAKITKVLKVYSDVLNEEQKTELLRLGWSLTTILNQLLQ